MNRAWADSQVAYKLQHYAEDDGRIRVDSAYTQVDVEFGQNWKISVEGIYNAISGATPTGLLPETPDGPVPTDELEDHREAVVVDLSTAAADWTFDLNLNAGQETDYNSAGAAFTIGREFNQKNTIATIAYGYTHDEVAPVFFASSERKEIHDVVVGLSQVIDPRTLFSINLAWSSQNGYLNDPYKQIQQDIDVLPGFTIPLAFKENRPRERTRWIVNTQLTHRFDALSGTLEGSYRHTSDDWNVHTHTMGLTWFQSLGSSVILQPSIRWLRQSAADFYRLSLNSVDFDPGTVESGMAPFYSSDHRLSKMQSLNIGLKLRWEVTDRLTLDANIERYTLRGLDDVTPDSTYSKANVFTLGGVWRF